MAHRSRLAACLAALLMMFQLGCGSSVEDLIDVADGVPRKTIDQSRVGTNSFFSESEFGSIRAQFNEIHNTLGINYVRALFAWTSGVQPTPNSALNFGFYDEIASSIPAGVDVVVVLTSIPDWMNDSSNWIGGDPRRTFVERWVRPVASRYAGNGRIIGWQIWNEPNMTANPENTVLGFVNNAPNYVTMLQNAYDVVKSISPNKLVLNAATTSINQNFPESVDYNRAMRDAGAENYTDRWAIHYYGEQFENVVRSDGVEEFFESISKPIWVTESGRQGVNNQLAYAERAWPFLIENLPNVERIYQYRFVENAPEATTWGLRNPVSVSDLYIYLRDN